MNYSTPRTKPTPTDALRAIQRHLTTRNTLRTKVGVLHAIGAHGEPHHLRAFEYVPGVIRVVISRSRGPGNTGLGLPRVTPLESHRIDLGMHEISFMQDELDTVAPWIAELVRDPDAVAPLEMHCDWRKPFGYSWTVAALLRAKEAYGRTLQEAC